MELHGQIEAILFVASKPLSLRDIARALGVLPEQVRDALATLQLRYNHEGSGLHLLSSGDEVQMATNPGCADAIREFVKQEAAGELTKAQLETLTVIAYRGPVTRPELEQIRGVNCALILRNLLVRGLVETSGDDDGILATYRLSFEALRHLGIRDVTELPDYAALHRHEYLEKATEAAETLETP